MLVRADTLAVLDLPASALASTIRLLAQGAGESGEAAAEVLITGRSVLPLAPAHLSFAAVPGGGGIVRWVRRSRAGWEWIDGVDAPLGEESERYRVTIYAAGTDRTGETVAPEILLTPDECPPGPQSRCDK